MAWMVPETRLDPEQREFLRRFSASQKNLWIQGFAGSGKSVLLVHSLIKALAANPGANACVVVYTHSLIDMIRNGIPEQLGHIPVKTYKKFKAGEHYDIVLVDEVQDVPAAHLEKLRQSANRLIVAGDEAQSIYDDGAPVHVIEQLSAAAPYRLSVVHRLTQKIIDIAQSVLPEKNLLAAKRSRLQNVDVVLACAENANIEAQWVWRQALAAAAPGAPVAVLLPRHEMILDFADAVLVAAGLPPWQMQLDHFDRVDYESFNDLCEAAGLPLRYLGNQYGALAEGDSEARVFLMTYHSAKGLDFETVFLPRLSDATEIWGGDDSRARTLLFVALTRSRLNLFLSYTDNLHPLLKGLPTALVREMRVSAADLRSDATVPDDGIVF